MVLRLPVRSPGNGTVLKPPPVRTCVQIVGYDTAVGRDDEPCLLLAEEGTVTRRSIAPGAHLSLRLGDRRCAGVVDGDSHQPCDREDAPHCAQHTHTWVCARCTGTCLKPEMDCHEEHVVYLAAFAPATFKVGVTRSWRFETRLREQGADRGAQLRTVPDGRIAREMETELATELTDRVRIPTKVAGLARSVREDAWERCCRRHDATDRRAFDYGLDLSYAPVADTVATGRVRGLKGRLLLLDRGGTTYVTDCRSLVGHHVEAGEADGDRQSNLAAFG